MQAATHSKEQTFDVVALAHVEEAVVAAHDVHAAAVDSGRRRRHARAQQLRAHMPDTY
jgi:hypothetical protein